MSRQINNSKFQKNNKTKQLIYFHHAPHIKSSLQIKSRNKNVEKQ